MTDLVQWSALVGVLLPGVLAVIQQPTFPKWARVLVMVVGSCVAALITAALQGQLDWARWEHSVIVVATLAVAFYNGGWKPSGLAPKIEAMTSRRHRASGGVLPGYSPSADRPSA